MTLLGIPLDPSFFTLLSAVAVAGVVRGFSGFGTGMIVGPVGAMTYGPQTALVLIIVIDTLPMAPLVVGAVREVDFRQIMPVLMGYGLLVPLGIWFLKTGDTTTLRWFMSVVILAAAAILWSGWYYRGPRNNVVRLGVGGLSGFLGGACGVGGPPVILYWMALRTGAGIVRANLLIFFAVTQVFSAAGFAIAGIVTREALLLGVLASPVYFVALQLGARLFGQASETAYKRIALAIVIAAAVLTLPALDGLR